MENLRSFSRVSLCALLGLAFASHPASAGTKELCTAYTAFLKKEGGRQSLQTESIRTTWIRKFEQDLASSEKADFFHYLAMAKLAGLYDIAGDLDNGLGLLETVQMSYDAPADLRLLAATKAVDISARAGEKLDKTLERLDGFADLVAEMKQAGTGYSDQYSRHAFLTDLSAANIIERYGTAEAARLRADGMLQQAAKLEVEHLIRAKHALDQYLKGFHAKPAEAKEYAQYLEFMNWDAPAVLHRIAALAVKAAAHYQAVENPQTEQALRSQAVEYLEDFFKKYPNNKKHSQQAAKLLLQQKVLQTGLDAKSVDYIAQLVPKVAEGHAIVTYIMSLARQASDNPKKLIIANSLCDIAIGLENKWFAAEHEGHVNFQEALLQKTENCLELGDITGAADTLNTLADLSLKGEHFQQLYRRLAKEYQQFYQEMLDSIDGNQPNTKVIAPVAPASPNSTRAEQGPSALLTVETHTREPRSTGPTTFCYVITCLLAVALFSMTVAYLRVRKRM